MRPGAELGDTDGEPTLIGLESWHDLSPGQLVRMQEQHRHRVQRRAVLGLMLLLGVVLPLGALAMIGVGMDVVRAVVRAAGPGDHADPVVHRLAVGRPVGLPSGRAGKVTDHLRGTFPGLGTNSAIVVRPSVTLKS